MNEFFAPLGKKDDISFSEFCSLFKSKSSGVSVFNSVQNNNLSKDRLETITVFPIKIQRK